MEFIQVRLDHAIPPPNANAFETETSHFHSSQGYAIRLAGSGAALLIIREGVCRAVPWSSVSWADPKLPSSVQVTGDPDNGVETDDVRPALLPVPQEPESPIILTGEPKRGPGRPPGSKNRPRLVDGSQA